MAHTPGRPLDSSHGSVLTRTDVGSIHATFAPYGVVSTQRTKTSCPGVTDLRSCR